MTSNGKAKQKNNDAANGCIGGFLLLVLLGFAFSWCTSDSSNPSTNSTSQVPDAECIKTLQCWGERHMVDASVRCDDFVERLAKNNFEWTDGILEPKFSHYRWKNETTGEVTYIGDKIKFQNGFGAWIFHTYECDLDATGQSVTDVRARPGRLAP